MMGRKKKHVWEFGDFQTPVPLARMATEAVARLGVRPNSILEPACGRGAFLAAAMEAFPDAKRFVGVEINSAHLNHCENVLSRADNFDRVRLLHGDFFALDWDEILRGLPDPILIVGNPPWVTSAELGMLGSANLPPKSNFQKRSGMEALTGKSNFDISEWMLLQHLEWLRGRQGVMGMLCKTSVARKVLAHANKHGDGTGAARIYAIDAMKHFQASVDACFFVLDQTDGTRSGDCEVYDDIQPNRVTHITGCRDDSMIYDVPSYERWRHLRGLDDRFTWRSGVKHDRSSIMELTCSEGSLHNGLGEEIDIEDTYLYPLYKSSDIANGRLEDCRKRVIVTQTRVGEDTRHIESDAPKTWDYLQRHKELLESRSSSIYRGKPEFSIFGIGDYSFAPWKVAISGLYKKLEFQIVAPIDGRPAMVDDTVYLVPCESEGQAEFVASLLRSRPAQEFLQSMVFWAEKRPIRSELLKRLNIGALAAELGRRRQYEDLVAPSASQIPGPLFETNAAGGPS